MASHSSSRRGASDQCRVYSENSYTLNTLLESCLSGCAEAPLSHPLYRATPYTFAWTRTRSLPDGASLEACLLWLDRYHMARACWILFGGTLTRRGSLR